MKTSSSRSEIVPSNLYSLEHISDFLGVSERFIREKLIHTKIVRSVKVGRRFSVKGEWLISGLSNFDGEEIGYD